MGMMDCLQCGVALDSLFVSGGSTSSCKRCRLHYVSIGHLMKQSDTALVREFWEYVLDGDWSEGRPCPHCSHALSLIPLVHGGAKHPVMGCKTCYHVVLQEGTMAHFEQANPAARRRRNLLPQAAGSRERPDSLLQLAHRVADATESRWQIKISNAEGREYAFALSLGGVVLGVVALMSLRQTGGAMHWSVLAAASAFFIGLKLARGARLADTTKSSEAVKPARDIGRQSGVPMAMRGGPKPVAVPKRAA